jgi:histidinol phosphate phosphatase HisJ family
MILSNLHTHTNFSDGKNTPEEMIEAAIARGFVSLGISDHGYSVHDSGSMRPADEAVYRKTITDLADKYKNHIEVILGYERDATTPETDITPYAYTIESVHFAHKDGEVFPIDYSPKVLSDAANRLFGGDWNALTHTYFREVCAMVSLPNRGGILGHIDLVSKFNEKHPSFDENSPAFLNDATEALELAVAKDMIVEINTGAMSRGWRTIPYPTAAILKRLHAMGGRILFSADAHAAAHINHAFDEAVDLARACGYKSAVFWKNGELTETAL